MSGQPSSQFNLHAPFFRRAGAALITIVLVLVGLTACTLSSVDLPPTPTLMVLPTLSAETVNANGTPTASPITVERGGGDCILNAAFVADVTIPDDTPIEAGQGFTKTWRMTNNGTCEWDAGYQIVHVRGDALGVAPAAPVPAAPAGAQVDIAVDMVAPDTPGTYTSTWQLQSPEGTLFGTVPYVQIVVPDAPAADQAAPPAPTAAADDPAPVQANGCQYDAIFVTDVTIPDNTIIEPGAPFTKTWRLRNTGTCGWEEGVRLVWVTRQLMGAPYSVPVPATPPGSEVDVSVTFTAPTESGTYLSTWVLSAPDGNYFGPRPYVQIVVDGSGGQPVAAAPTPTPAPVQAPTATSPPVPDGDGYIHNLTPRAREIYLHGQTRGNRRNMFAKIGDSITHSWAYLMQIGDGVYKLAPEYAYLQSVINYYGSAQAFTGNAFNTQSQGATGGWTSSELLDAEKAAPGCGGAVPIVCEYDTNHSSVAIIMIGTNDPWRYLGNGVYETNLRTILDLTIDRGVIPVLSTIPPTIQRDVTPFNAIITGLAYEYGIPLMDYHGAMVQLPNQGLASDGVHPSIPADNLTAHLDPSHLQYGYPLRNLLTLQTLDALLKQVMY